MIPGPVELELEAIPGKQPGAQGSTMPLVDAPGAGGPALGHMRYSPVHVAGRSRPPRGPRGGGSYQGACALFTALAGNVACIIETL